MANHGFTGREQNKRGCYGTKLIGQEREAELQNKARENLGLSPRKVTRRICLRCEVAFSGFTEARLCNDCRRLNAESYEVN
jgi:hypothetical protein